jgi:hypothetical protein
MRLPSALLFATLCTPVVALAAQAPADTSAPAAPASAPVPSSTPAPVIRTPTAILQPALDTIKSMLPTLHPDRWKTSNILRDETASNLDSIQRDMDTTLPTLLTAADSAPNSVARILPAYRNIEALYDVLLRVAQVGRLSAPGPQTTALDQATAGLDDARRALGDRLQVAALAQEKQVTDLQAALRAVPKPEPPAPAVIHILPPAKKPTPTKKPAAKKPTPPPTTATPASSTPASSPPK